MSAETASSPDARADATPARDGRCATRTRARSRAAAQARERACAAARAEARAPRAPGVRRERARVRRAVARRKAALDDAAIACTQQQRSTACSRAWQRLPRRCGALGSTTRRARPGRARRWRARRALLPGAGRDRARPALGRRARRERVEQRCAGADGCARGRTRRGIGAGLAHPRRRHRASMPRSTACWPRASASPDCSSRWTAAHWSRRSEEAAVSRAVAGSAVRCCARDVRGRSLCARRSRRRRRRCSARWSSSATTRSWCRSTRTRRGSSPASAVRGAACRSSIRLGPGLLGRIFDGLLRPLSGTDSDFVQPGMRRRAAGRCHFEPRVAVGDA